MRPVLRLIGAAASATCILGTTGTGRFLAADDGPVVVQPVIEVVGAPPTDDRQPANSAGLRYEALYTDYIAPGFGDWSWTSVDWASDAEVYDGDVSIELNLAGWEGFGIGANDPLEVTGNELVSFAIHGGYGEPVLIGVGIYDEQRQARVPVEVMVAPGQWTVVEFSLAELGAVGIVHGIVVQNLSNDDSGPVFLDNIRIEWVDLQPPVAVNVGDEEPRLERGVNFAGDFEVEPRGTQMEPEWFAVAAEAGFDHVRVPIRWSSYTGPSPDFTINEAFAVEVDTVIANALAADLSVVIDVHHFEELDADPAANADELLAIWRQLGDRYADQPGTVVFELLNEPQATFSESPQLWNTLLRDTLTVVRETNPNRTVIVGPVAWNHPNALNDLELPQDDNLVVTVHSYDPTTFTLQGATWMDPAPANGVTWSPTDTVIGQSWTNNSWGIDTRKTADGLEVKFNEQWTALGVASGSGPRGAYETLTIDADDALNAVILCDVTLGEPTVVDLEPISGDATQLQADISECGSVRDLAIQSTSEGEVTVTINNVEVCGNTGCDWIITDAATSLDEQMADSAAWAAARGHETYLGEFGVYDDPNSPVDPVSRAAWIRTMREAAEANGVNWAYFDFANEFGVFDPARSQYRADMLEALLG